MLHPSSELRFIDPEIGYGVFATKDIPKGTITWALDAFDQDYSPEEVAAMDEIHKAITEKYAYRNRFGHYILCWDFGRYVNHSFRSNCFATGYDFEIAVRDIKAGEEITNDYGYLNLLTPFKAREENSVRKYVYPDDLMQYHGVWDALVASCLPFLFQVPQPLLQLIPERDLTEIRETISGKRKMRSILTHYCQEELSPTLQ